MPKGHYLRTHAVSANVFLCRSLLESWVEILRSFPHSPNPIERCVLHPSLPGLHSDGHVLLLRPRGAQRLRGMLQPPGQPHRLLRVQLPGEHRDLLGGVHQGTGAGSAGDQGPVP